MDIIAIYLIESVYINNQSVTNHQFIFFNTISAFRFSIALGIMWEMFDFVGNFLFKTNMIKGGLSNTATGLLVKLQPPLLLP
jgi:putative membrane protein